MDDDLVYFLKERVQYQYIEYSLGLILYRIMWGRPVRFYIENSFFPMFP